jgi:hypothetical protein
MASKPAQVVVAPPPPPPAQNIFGDPAAFGAMIAAIAASVTRPPVLAPPVPIDHSDQDAKLDFPTLRDWLASIVDLQPTLVQYADALEANGIDRLNYVDNPDLSISTLRAMTGMNFVQASAFLRMGKKACQEFREAYK